jgi:hypothetical protein
MSHQIDPEFVREVADWLRAKLGSADRG